MNPAFSVVLFTTLIGAAQGSIVTLALATLAGVPLSPGFVGSSLIVAEAMLLVGLGASFAHLGRPERAWRAVLMWRTSWLSREVIVLPAFIGVVALWWLASRAGTGAGAAAGTVAGVLTDSASHVLPIAAIAVAALLWYCTAMIYACIRFIEEWAQPLTVVTFTLTGLASGLVLASALAAIAGEAPLLRTIGPCAFAVTLIAGAARLLALRRNARLKHKSTLQSATGIASPNLVQKSMGMSAGSFNTREFFHGRTLALMRQARRAAIVFGFGLPAALALLAMSDAVSSSSGLWAAAVACQAIGLLADRWLFFAQAKHPQNLYYQVVS